LHFKVEKHDSICLHLCKYLGLKIMTQTARRNVLNIGKLFFYDAMEHFQQILMKVYIKNVEFH